MPDLAIAPPAPLALSDVAPLVAPAAAPPLDQHPAAVYLAQLAKRSRRSQHSALNQVAQLLGYTDALACPWANLRYQHTAALRAQLAERYAAATANRMLAALRRVLQEAWRLDQMSAEEYRRAADVKVIKSQPLPAGRALSLDEVSALLAACAADATPAGVRDSALIAVLVATGLRRSEIVALNLADYDPLSGALKVRRGKGNKGRVVYVRGGAAAMLADWLTLRGGADGPLFYAAARGGHLTARPLSDSAIPDILSRRATAAGVATFSPHDLRRTNITELLDHGADLATVQRLAGHADPATTARYDRRGEQAKKDAADLLELPDLRRRTLPLDD